MELNIKQNKEIRYKNYIRIINKMIQSYIKNPIGDLDLYRILITRLPKNLKVVNGNLDIRYTGITELPRGLVVNGSLNINRSNISELPDDITINSDLLCFFTPLSNLYTESELRNKFNIKGYVYGTKY